MANPSKSMTTSEFAKATGIPAAAVSKLIRDGKLKAKKEGKCWMITASQLEAKAVRELGKAAKPAKGKKTKKPAPSRKAAEPVRAAIPVPAKPAASAAVLQPAPVPASARPAAEKVYTVAEFAAMTYLTENGVAEWLKTGRLQGRQEAGGQWVVFESNLQVPDISRLVRK
ncbi:MAG: helix-turn-helix domain-containing protein [Desulfobacterales bacterium]